MALGVPERTQVAAVSKQKYKEKSVIANEVGFETRYKHLRSGVRVNSKVAIAVEWTESGEKYRAEGCTVDVSPRGCLAIVPHKLSAGQELQLINLVNQNKREAILIWRGHEGRAGWELGLEIQGKTEDFWGIDF